MFKDYSESFISKFDMNDLTDDIKQEFKENTFNLSDLGDIYFPLTKYYDNISLLNTLKSNGIDISEIIIEQRNKIIEEILE
jgi:hypothetical protein